MGIGWLPSTGWELRANAYFVEFLRGRGNLFVIIIIIVILTSPHPECYVWKEGLRTSPVPAEQAVCL